MNSDKEETQSECTDRIEASIIVTCNTFHYSVYQAEPIACIRVSSDCIKNHKRALCPCHSTKQACDSDKVKKLS